MDGWNLRDFKNDLSAFIDLIRDHNVPGDFQNFIDLKDNLDRNGIIDYNLQDMCFFVSSGLESQPTETNHFQVYLDNFLKFKDDWTPENDPLFKYKFEINIHGYKNKRSEGQCYKCSWHLDKHSPSENDKFTHASYHFQFGGKKIKNVDSGNLLLLQNPRIPHPPMDIFLGFHFVIANFYNSKSYTFVREMTSDSVYQQIIKRAQNRLWTPYFDAYGENNSHNDFTRKNVFPLFLEN
jgi:hypothetical protein